LQLPDLQRRVVVLRVWNGLSYQVIGEILGRTEGTVRSHMCHAVASMRNFLEPRLRQPEP
jgi:RNA polymerase sigma-70 factor (ECF subfamily)